MSFIDGEIAAHDGGLTLDQPQGQGVEPLGPHTLINGTFAGEKFTAQMPAGTSYGAGETAEVQLNLSKAHLFDKATGLVRK